MDFRNTQTSDKFMLWVDAVGGFWVCTGDEIVFGQPVGSGTPGSVSRGMSAVDIPILGDISSRHARIRRDEEGYLIEAIRDVYINGKRVKGMASLIDGTRIELGGSVRMVFRRPHPLSATARLDFASHHRTQPSADAILLMADACILGPTSVCHVVCRDWKEEVVLYRRAGQLCCRTAGRVEIDGILRDGKGPIALNSQVRGEGFSLGLEEI